MNKLGRVGRSEETPDKTDGESSYSSFYSSFFKTESGSAEESGDPKFNKEKRFRVTICYYFYARLLKLVFCAPYKCHSATTAFDHTHSHLSSQ